MHAKHSPKKKTVNMNPYFDTQIPKIYNIPKWKKLIFKLLPKYVSFDENMAVFWVKWQKKIYIVGNEYYTPKIKRKNENEI